MYLPSIQITKAIPPDNEHQYMKFTYCEAENFSQNNKNMSFHFVIHHTFLWQRNFSKCLSIWFANVKGTRVFSVTHNSLP